MIKFIRSLTNLVIALILVMVTLVPPAFALDDALTHQVLKTKEPSSLNLEKSSLERANPSIDERGKVDVLKIAPSKTELEELPLLYSYIHPPLQPKTGPGGSDYIYKKVNSSHHCLNTIQQQCVHKQDEYWIFEPLIVNENLQNLPNFPLIVFLHGWHVMSPNYYGSWIEHIVKQGNIVIFPVFQNSASAPINSESVEVAIKVIIDATKDAVEKLRNKYPVNEKIKIALIGHSAGGAMAAISAAKIAITEPTLYPLAIISVEPYSGGSLTYENLSKIPEDSVLLSLVENQDIVAGKKDAEKIFWLTTKISAENKNFVEVKCDLTNHFSSVIGCAKDPRSDFYCPLGDKSEDCLTSGHLAPLSYKKLIEQTGEGSQLIAFVDSFLGDISGVSSSHMRNTIRYIESMFKSMTEEEIQRFLSFKFGANAIDYYSFWKLSVALSNVAFHDGKDREYALGDTKEQKDMGQWLDKNDQPVSPVNQLCVTVNPPNPDTKISSYPSILPFDSLAVSK